MSNVVDCQRAEEDEAFKSLILQAQSFPLRHPQRGRALTALTHGLLQSGRLSYPRRLPILHSSELYQEVRQEAIQLLLIYVCHHPEKYDPDRGSVMIWANFLLQRRFFPQAIELVLGCPKLPRIPCEGNRIRELPTPYDEPSLTDLIRQCLLSDPTGEFATTHPRRQPLATFQRVALRRLERVRWQDIAAEVNVPIATLNEFYQRNLRKFAPIFREYTCDDWWLQEYRSLTAFNVHPDMHDDEE